MNDISNYIYSELLKIPFNLIPIITNYIESNKKVKVAIVGGYLRDLLIAKIHKKSFIKSIDIDIVTEGSSIDLAKFIKKNIYNVELCMIKEFELFNTVELNINNLKIDIASARKEKYEAPGLNPIIKNATIKEDLKRRDFSINAIAYEISENHLYDPFNGVHHIQKKELHLLHENSIRDDPSRLLRCAKYSARLGFMISTESLLQSQNIINEWPWKFKKNEFGYKFPPGISIRIRMELTEILKYDDLKKIIKKLEEWNVLSLLNESIEVSNKFLRGLSWLKKIKGNTILYLIKDSESIDIISDRFFINQKEKTYLKKFFEVKEFLKNNEKEMYEFSPSDWTTFIEERNLDPETVKLIICEGGIFWRKFFKWLMIYRYIKSDKNGEDLKNEGWEIGKKIGIELNRLRHIKIDEYRKR